MKKVINRKVYDTKTSEEVCCNGILNQNGCTRCTELYKTSKGNFFFYYRTMWQGEENSIIPCSEQEAANFYEGCNDTSMEWEEAFPDITIEEA